MALGAVAVVLGLVIAFGALALFGAPLPWSTPGNALAGAVAAAVGGAGAWVHGRRGRRRD
jgi:hypothetical protein